MANVWEKAYVQHRCTAWRCLSNSVPGTSFEHCACGGGVERASFELRGEFFNVFNHANFGYPGGTVGTAQFATVSSTLNPGRQVQLAAKIHF